MRANIRHLQCRPSDGKWVLSDDTPLPPITEAHGGHPLAHLSWNETGSELAVVDSSGRVSVYSISIALNHIAGLRQAMSDADDDGGQIVGMMWLNTQRSVGTYLPLFSCTDSGLTALGTCFSPSVQIEWPVGILPLPPAANWSFPPSE